MIAKHVMNIHMNRPNINGDEDGNAIGEIDLDKMKAYIAYCKKCVFVSCLFSWRTYHIHGLANVLHGYQQKHKKC
jgi:hypothetical protein